MAAIAKEPIKAIRKGALQPLHTGGKVRVFCLDAAVIVIWHYDVGKQPPAESRTAVEQRSLKCLVGARHGKDFLSIIAAIKHMIDCTTIFDSGFSWHVQSLRKVNINVNTNIQSLNPFLPFLLFDISAGKDRAGSFNVRYAC